MNAAALIHTTVTSQKEPPVPTRLGVLHVPVNPGTRGWVPRERVKVGFQQCFYEDNITEHLYSVL